jgi:predicted anti-sigma-YlaC factor YlaD
MKRWFMKLSTRVMASCHECTTHCSDHMEGALSDAQKTRLQRHLKLCAACRAYRDQTEASVLTLRELPKPEIDETEKGALLQRFRQRQAR